MNLRKSLSVVIVAMAFCVVAAAAGTPQGSRNVVFSHDATIAGAHLASGDCKITWETHSPAATVTFIQRKKVVATAEGKVVDRGTTYSSNSVIYSLSAAGTRVIQEIRFKGSSEVIVFGE